MVLYNQIFFSLFSNQSLFCTLLLIHRIFCSQQNVIIATTKCSKTCVKRPLKNRQNKDLNDKW